MVGWHPVIATVELSRIISVIGISSVAASIRPVMPECKKVESPITARLYFKPASEAPFAMPTDAPMQTMLSIAE
jgi:hypothetical protein